MPVAEAPDDDGNVRQSYNFAPGYHGLVYRAEAPETDTQYKLQSMQWGLVPFWTKRNPDYASKMKTINCRDDSLIEDRGMWTTMKKKKRCIVVAQGFYEWLKKNGGKDKIPHFTKRKDGQLMCFAGLWDCVEFEDSDEKLFTYTIITTESNKQLSFLHDRMPVILDNGSEAIRTWLDPNRTEWSTDLQSLLKPFHGELECYPVSKDVGKVGNNSPSFLVPINSAANKNNIANFFGSQRAAKVEHDPGEHRATTDRVDGTEDNAPLPVPDCQSQGIKREHHDEDSTGSTADKEPASKRIKPEPSASPTTTSPAKPAPTARKRGTRSATSNGSAAKTPKSDGSQRITAFFTSK
jgi:putative SOS response-associated peptidase YedK